MTIKDQTHGKVHLSALSTDTKPTEGMVAGSIIVETDTGSQFMYNGDGTAAGWLQISTGGGGHVTLQAKRASDGTKVQILKASQRGDLQTSDGFRPSQYDADLTMDGTGQSVALASGVSLGDGRVKVTNRGATTEAIRFVFGTSAANAIANLTIVGGLSTTGDYIPAPADGLQPPPYGVPALATHCAVANAVASDVQIVSITQGV